MFGIGAILGINARVRWLGKHSVFKFGVTWFFRWLGGIPVNRAQPDAVMGYVDEAVAERQWSDTGGGAGRDAQESGEMEERVSAYCQEK